MTPARPVSAPRVALFALATAHAGPALSPHAGALGDLLGIVRRAPRPGSVALTFDDGPHPQATPRVLERLAGDGARATFFLVGEQVRREPALAREIVAAGHAVALHGDTHRCELRLTPGQLAADRARGAASIEDTTGVACTALRPPYGAASGAGLVLARRAGLRTVLWSRWGRDWRAAADGRSVARDVIRAGLGEREVVLLHDADHYGAPGCWRATVASLPAILEACRARGLETVAL